MLLHSLHFSKALHICVLFETPSSMCMSDAKTCTDMEVTNESTTVGAIIPLADEVYMYRRGSTAKIVFKKYQ